VRLFRDLFGLVISEGDLNAVLQRAKPCFDRQVAAILVRLRKSRVIYSDETSVRVDGSKWWNWVFQNDDIVLHVIRRGRDRGVIEAVLDGHRPALWVSDLYGPQQGHADAWQVCLAHQLRDCQYAIDAGDAMFAPRMKRLLLRAFVIAKRRKDLVASTRRSYLSGLNRDLDAIMAMPVRQEDGKRLRKRYAKHRGSLFTFLKHPEIAPDNNSSERTCVPLPCIATSPVASAQPGVPISTPPFAPTLAPPPNRGFTPSTLSAPHYNPEQPDTNRRST